MQRKILICLILAGLILAGVGYARGQSKKGSSKNLDQKVNEILKNQQKILEDIEYIKGELRKIKMRVT